MPSSIKEGLIDLCYNSGLGTFKNSPKLLNAIKNKDYSSVIGNLATVYARKNGKLEESAGLYRRSLSRAILAARDLTGFEKIQADKEIDNLYQAKVIDRDLFLQAKLILNRERRYEEKMAKERKKAKNNG